MHKTFRLARTTRTKVLTIADVNKTKSLILNTILPQDIVAKVEIEQRSSQDTD